MYNYIFSLEKVGLKLLFKKLSENKIVLSGGEAKLTSPKLIHIVHQAEVNIMMISTYLILTEDLSKICILPKHPSIIETR